MTRKISYFYNPSSNNWNSRYFIDGQSAFHQGDDAPDDNFLPADEDYQRIHATIRAESLEKTQDLTNFPNDNNIEDFLRWKQINAQGESYEYWTNNLPTKEDRQNLKPLHGAVFYDQLVDLIKSKVKIVRSPQHVFNEDNKLLLAQVINNYCLYITKKSENFQLVAVSDTYPDQSNDLFRFNGLNLEIEGQIHDLSSGHLGRMDFLSNIVSSGKSFICYDTLELLKAYLSHRVLPFHECIYLNPQVSQSVRIAGELIDKFEEDQLSVQVKILNRSLEGGKHHILDIKSWGIAISSSRSQTDQVLSTVLRLYRQNYPLFAQRSAPKLATQIADGVAVATLEGFNQEQYSFNGHRAYIFDKSWAAFKFYQMSTSSVTHHDIQTFKQILQQECRQSQIDIYNISFPNRMTFRR